MAEFVDGSPCSFVAVIDFSYMVYFNFFGCILPPLLAMFAVYGYIYTVVRGHIARIAAMMPPASQAVVVVATVQQQDPAVSQENAAVGSSSVEMTVPTSRRGRTVSTVTTNDGIW